MPPQSQSPSALNRLSPFEWPEGILETLDDCARRAGQTLLEFRGNLKHIIHKGDIDLVTEADHAAEGLVIETIRKRFPGHSILAEESGALAGVPGTQGDSSAAAGEAAGDWRWVIDPLDGTTNFAHAMPLFCVSIGVQHRGQTLAGAVYAPALGEFFEARLGEGARLNGSPIRVSAISDLNESLVVTGFPYDRRERVDHYMRYYGKILKRTQGVLRLGSAALDLCNVACGRLEAFWEEKLHPWDTAAGDLIVREAGGCVTRFDGGEYEIFSPDILATNGNIHAAIKELLRP